MRLRIRKDHFTTAHEVRSVAAQFRKKCYVVVTCLAAAVAAIILMGIKKLFPFIEKRCKSAVRSCTLSDYNGKSVAIDVSGFLYRFLYAETQWTYLRSFGNFFVELKNNNIEPFFVFDGGPLPEKANTKEARTRKKIDLARKALELKLKYENAKRIFQDAPPTVLVSESNPEAEGEIEILREAADNAMKRVIHVSTEQVKNVKGLLALLGAKCIVAHAEAEGTCAVMNRLGQVYCVMSGDSDVIAFDGVRLVRVVAGAKAGEQQYQLKEYDIPEIRNTLGVSQQELVELSILCGTDFTGGSKIAGIGPAKGYALVQKYGTIDNIIANMSLNQQAKIPTTFDYEAARGVFRSYCEMSEPYAYTVGLNCDEFSYERLIGFLRGKMPDPRLLATMWTRQLTGKEPKRKQDTEDDSMWAFTDTSKWGVIKHLVNNNEQPLTLVDVT